MASDRMVPEDKSARAVFPALVILIAFGAAALWLPQLGSSFWLDETGTVWLTRGGLADTVSRSFDYQGGSIPFLVTAWTARRVAGLSEIALRLPSTIAMAGAAAFVFVLGRQLYDRWVGLLAAAFFVALPAVAFAASDARPYALALLTLSASGVALVRWLDTMRTRDGVVYAAVASLTVFVHYLFGLAVLGQLAYLAYRMASRESPGVRKIVPVAGGFVVFLLPAVPTFLRILEERSVLSVASDQSPVYMVRELIPPRLLVVFAVAVAAGSLWPPRGMPGLRKGAAPLLAAWVLLPAVTMYVVSTLTSTNVFLPRYYLMILPAVALVAALAVRRLPRTWVQAGVAALVLFVSLGSFTTTQHKGERWEEGAAALREAVDDPATPVLLFAGFVEARQDEWLDDPERSSYLNAPATAYPMDGRLIPLPFELDAEGAEYMERVVRDDLSEADEFFLVTRGSWAAPYKEWLDEELTPQGFDATLLGSFGPEVVVYEYRMGTGSR